MNNTKADNVQTDVKCKVKWFNDAKGFGFLTAENDSGDIFVHYSAITSDGFKTLSENSDVTADIMTGPKGPQAINVRKVD